MSLFIILASFMLTALTEYLLHRYYLHKNSGHPHITDHHINFHGNSTYENPEAERNEIVSNLAYILISWTPCVLVSLHWVYTHIFYGFLFAFTGLCYLTWVETVHYLFHKPHNFYIEGTHTFYHLKKHHRTHHTYYKTNYGIGSSIWDYIFQTKK